MITELEWDSAFFGMKVGKLTGITHSVEIEERALEVARSAGFKLLYATVEHPLEATTLNRLDRFGVFLADQKASFICSDLTEITRECASQISSLLGPSDPAMESLAILAGEFSRFRLDPRIPKGKFEELYRLWIRKSISREFADEVIVVRIDGDLAGLLTMSQKETVGNLGLIAVDPKFRGRGVGSDLVQGFMKWSAERGCLSCMIPTQLANEPACRLYTRAGFKLHSVESLLHFWL